MRRVWVILLSCLLVGCGSDAATSTTPPPVTTVASSTTTITETTVTPSTSVAASTTTMPPGIVGLVACRDAVMTGTTTAAELDTAIAACDVQNDVNKLTGPGAQDVGFALLKFGIELDQAKLLVEGGGPDKTQQAEFASAVLTFLTAVHTYLNY